MIRCSPTVWASAQWAFSRHLGPVVEELLLPEGLGFFAGSPEPGAPRGEAVEGWLGGFAGEEKSGDSDVAVRLGFLRRGGNTFCLSALTAPVRDDTRSAFRTPRAFEIARDSLGVPNAP